jgi:hypothetical protein
MLADLCRTLNAGRAFLAERAAFLVSDLVGLLGGLRALAEGRDESAHYGGGLLAAPGEVWRIGPADSLERLAGHFLAGGAADWERLDYGGRVLSLPGYPFARDRFPLPSSGMGGRVEALDAILPEGDPGFTDHRWDGRAIFPATALLLLAARALGPKPCVVEAVRWHKPLAADNRLARLCVQPVGRVQLESSEGVHAEALARLARPDETPHSPAPQDVLPQGMGHAEVYRRFAAMGFEYGPAFRVVQQIVAVAGRAQADLNWPVGVQRGRIPAIGLLDGVVQSALGLLGTHRQPATVLPVGLDWAWIDSAALEAPLRVEVRELGYDARQTGERRLELLAWNAAGQVAAQLRGLTVRLLETPDSAIPLVYRPAWHRADALP